MLYTGEKPVDPLILNIYPLDDHQTSAYKLYSDASDSRAYERGICTWTPITASQNGDRLTVKIAPVEGQYPGMITERAYELRLPAGWPPESVTINGKALSFSETDSTKTGWRYDGNTLTTIITTPRYSVHTPVNIEVRRASGSLAARAQLDGFAGSIERLREAYNTLNSLLPYTWSPDPLIKALQTGDRISYHPENARKEIAAFSQNYAQALSTVQSLADAANIPDDELNKRLEHHTGYGSTASPAANYKLLVGRALAMLKDGQTSSASSSPE
jgi:alpha-glucosidase